MKYDILCFSHLRWNFVYQRPQHLLSRFAKERRVFVVEEPIFGEQDDRMEVQQDKDSKVWIITPFLFNRQSAEQIIKVQQRLLDSLLDSLAVSSYILWYYSPMALAYTDHLDPRLVVYDCMDELSAFKFAPPELIQYERKLFKKADLVFTGGQTLYESKRHFHNNIFAFPSSIDKAHFSIARTPIQEPADQKDIPHPRLGFYGVLDERLNIVLIEEMARLRPHWHFVLVGPVVKIDPGALPQKNNIHYLGSKQYQQLPAYLAGWDIAIMPFALNASTQFISPTKTPEYLAGGKPVISTAIKDVVTPYGKESLVEIADTAEEFIAAAEKVLTDTGNAGWLKKVDAFLSGISWDKTWQGMESLIDQAIKSKPIVQIKNTNHV